MKVLLNPDNVSRLGWLILRFLCRCIGQTYEKGVEDEESSEFKIN